MKKKELLDAAKEAVKRRGENFKLVSLGMGSFGAVFKAKGDNQIFAVKVTDENVARREFKELAALKKVCSAPVPEVMFLEIVNGYGCIGMEYIDGVNAYGNIRVYLHGAKKRRAFAEAVADGVRSLQQNTGDKFGDMDNPVYDRWSVCYRKTADKVMEGARKSNDRRIKKILPLLENLYWCFNAIFIEEPKKACLIHGDLCPMNMLVNPKTLELKAFIDPLNMRWADGEYELFQLFCQSGRYFKLYEVYKEKYSVSRNADIKCLFYAVFAEVEFFLYSGMYLSRIINPIVKKASKEIKRFRAEFIER